MGGKKRRPIEELGWSHDQKSLALSLPRDSDRACALVGAELLNDLLERLLRMQCQKVQMDENSQHSLITEWNAPLHNLTVRIKVLRAFGVISDELYRALIAVKEIRNLCAHRRGPIDLQDAEAEPHVRALREFLSGHTFRLEWDTQEGATPPYSDERTVFMDAVMLLGATLHYRCAKKLD